MWCFHKIHLSIQLLWRFSPKKLASLVWFIWMKYRKCTILIMGFQLKNLLAESNALSLISIWFFIIIFELYRFVNWLRLRLLGDNCIGLYLSWWCWWRKWIKCVLRCWCTKKWWCHHWLIVGCCWSWLLGLHVCLLLLRCLCIWHRSWLLFLSSWLIVNLFN